MTEKVPVKIDSRGRITVPKKAREEAGIEEGRTRNLREYAKEKDIELDE